VEAAHPLSGLGRRRCRLHLAQTDEMAIASLGDLMPEFVTERMGRETPATVDDGAAAMVAREIEVAARSAPSVGLGTEPLKVGRPICTALPIAYSWRRAETAEPSGQLETHAAFTPMDLVGRNRYVT
jgi:hypothetical protein